MAEATTIGSNQTAQQVIPPEMTELFADPPLLPDENPAEYDQVVVQMALVARPYDYIDWINVRDAADELWNAQRMRRIKAAAITAAQAAALEDQICFALKSDAASETSAPDASADLEHSKNARTLTWAWMGKEGGELEQQVNVILKKARINLKVLAAQGVANRIGVIEVFDRLIAACDRRRDAALHAVAVRRAVREADARKYDIREAAE